MEADSLSYKTLRNSGYLLVGFVLPMFFTIFVTRALVTKLGVGEFGIFVLLNAISSFVSYVDLGFSTAIIKYVSEYQSRNDLDALRNILSSARILFFVTGLFGLLIFTVLGKWFLPIFHISAGDGGSMLTVFILAGVAFFVNSINTIYSSILSSLQRFDLLTKINIFNLAFVSIATIVLLNMGFQLKAIMALNVASLIMSFLIYRYLCHSLMPQLSLGFVLVKSEIKKAYSFGLLTFISNLAVTSLFYFDRLLIPSFLGPSQLAFYSVPGNVALKIPGVTNSLSGMLFPMTSALSGEADREKLTVVYTKIFRNLSVVAAAITVAIVLFANKILFFWLGSEYANKGTEVLIILAVTHYLISLYVPLQGMLLGLGEVKFLVKQSLFMATINIILLVVMVPRWGIVGAAWSYFFSILPTIFAFYWIEQNVFSLTTNRGLYYLKLYYHLAVTALVNGVIIYFVARPLVNNVWSLVTIGPFCVLLFFVVYYIFGFAETEDIVTIKSFIVKFFRLNI